MTEPRLRAVEIHQIKGYQKIAGFDINRAKVFFTREVYCAESHVSHV